MTQQLNSPDPGESIGCQPGERPLFSAPEVGSEIHPHPSRAVPGPVNPACRGVLSPVDRPIFQPAQRTRRFGSLLAGGGTSGAASVAEAALEMIQSGFVVGLGSGRAATAFVRALGHRVRKGLRVRAIATSYKTANLATQVGIPLVGLGEIEAIDVTVDGADEVDPDLDLIKGLGGALVREKIIASASRRLVILVGSEKLVPALGSHGVLPVEVVPFGRAFCQRRLTELGYASSLREAGERPFMSDNHNCILDCEVPVLRDPAEVERTLRAIPGVVGTGLFLGMADTVLIQDGDEVRVRRRERSRDVGGRRNPEAEAEELPQE
jgi:ribose 5-phosphate isomerase A